MRLLLNNFKNRANYLEKVIGEKEESLKNAPQGYLRAAYKNGESEYYLKNSKKEKRGRYLKQTEREIAILLAQKEYDEKVLKYARTELNSLNKLIRRYEIGTAEDIYENLPPARRALVTPILLPDDEFVKNWLAQQYEGLGFEEGAPEFYADSGLRVRSKSEIGIANKYGELQIPMLFERPLKLKGWKTVYPDFTLLNVRLRKEFIHEHLGKMDDPEYAEENVAKLNAYEKNGYYPGKNLILTFETKGNPFDVRKIEDITKQYLL